MPARIIADWPGPGALNRAPNGQHFGFQWSLNPYRGCAHGCRYCYARDSHSYLDLGIGADFETRLFVKPDLPLKLARELQTVPLSERIAIGTVTDPYQPLEGRYRLTRRALELIAHSGHPATITTKSPLILRDLDLLQELGRRGQVVVNISLISMDKHLLRHLEPHVATPERRIQVVARLRDHGVPTGVFLAPVIPLLSDQPQALAAVFEAAASAGSLWLMAACARLSSTLKPYFLAEVSQWNPTVAERLRALYGDQQMPSAAYQKSLQARLSPLYPRYRLSPTPKLPHPFRRHEQVEFPFQRC
jgi:DNA repair photolyase